MLQKRQVCQVRLGSFDSQLILTGPDLSESHSVRSQQGAAQPPASASHHNEGAIIGGVLGGVLGALLLASAVGLAVWLRHRSKRSQRSRVSKLASLQAAHHQNPLRSQGTAPAQSGLWNIAGLDMEALKRLWAMRKTLPVLHEADTGSTEYSCL